MNLVQFASSDSDNTGSKREQSTKPHRQIERASSRVTVSFRHTNNGSRDRYVTRDIGRCERAPPPQTKAGLLLAANISPGQGRKPPRPSALEDPRQRPTNFSRHSPEILDRSSGAGMSATGKRKRDGAPGFFDLPASSHNFYCRTPKN
ncbi:hypothetical protein GWI33_010434 [Rhynchophorus ferrugineus]|uniref:Uncharacterized protein n=1 Tax=Rhynchophorus ferrugineus TaxID=354439 RepID=A0A834I8E9_RHYFE|nr:hypothetical protein GWI33_010434 [Rhynchophorus ferrugineus]